MKTKKSLLMSMGVLILMALAANAQSDAQSKPEPKSNPQLAVANPASLPVAEMPVPDLGLPR